MSDTNNEVENHVINLSDSDAEIDNSTAEFLDNQSLLDAINTAYESGAYPDDLTSSARRQHHRRMIEGEW